MQMRKLPLKDIPRVNIRTIIGAIIIAIVILTLFMFREIYPNNPFIMKYLSGGYLIMEVIAFFGILWGADIWMARRREKRKKGTTVSKISSQKVA